MKYAAPLLTLLLFALPAAAQIDLSGSWTGTLTQDAGGYRSNYRFEMYLVQKGSQLTGRTYVSVDDINAVLEIVGDVVGNNLVRFRETKFVKYTELETMEWCYKTGVLELKRSGSTLRLQGTWEGMTSFGRCIPGKIFLTRQKPQA
jgi:hypothetical protein